MRAIHRSRTSSLGSALVLALALFAPMAVSAEEQVLVAAPAGPSWDETSGYGAVESSRAANALAAAPEVITSQVPSDVRWAPDAGTTWDAVSGYRSVEASRVLTGMAATAWDETSGYGSVEASRAAR